MCMWSSVLKIWTLTIILYTPQAELGDRLLLVLVWTLILILLSYPLKTKNNNMPFIVEVFLKKYYVHNISL